MCSPQVCEGYGQQIERILRTVDVDPLIAEEVASIDLKLTLVAAGYALALVGASQIATWRNSDVIGRPLAGRSPMLITYLLRRDSDPSETLSRFIDRIGPVSAEAAATRPSASIPNASKDTET
jgi:DNA-binding transcriptional LysR family regulator